MNGDVKMDVGEMRLDVLLVDDDGQKLGVIRRMLEKGGYQVLTITNGVEALAVARDKRPRLVLIDQVMPDITGCEVCAQIKAAPSFRDTLVVMFSAYETSAEDREHGLDEGADLYLSWPFSQRELLAQVSVLLRLKDDELRLRHAYDILQRSEERFRQLVEESPLAMLIVDPDERIEYVNGKFKNLFGYDQDDLQNLTEWWKMAYPGGVGLDRANTAWEEARGRLSHGQEEVFLGETVIETRDGHTVTVEGSCIAVDDRLVLAFSDLTKHKRVEEALAVERNRLRTLIDSLPHPVYVKDREGRFLAANATQAQVTGAGSPSAMIGKSDFDFYPAELAARYWADDLQVMTSGQAIIDREEPRVDALGLERQIVTTKVPLFDNRGDVIGLVGIGRDITQQKQEQAERDRLRDQLLQSQKMEAVGQLTAGIAHDFNNLLTAVTGFAELMQLEMDPKDALYSYAERILDSSHRAADLVRQLMIFSRREKIEPQVVDLNQTLSSMRNMLRRLISEDISLEVTLADDLWPVLVDPGQIQQVVVNLAVNARDAMPQGGKLTIETSNIRLDERYAATHLEVEPGDYVLLAVSDTGVGMSETVKAHVFEPFFTTKARGKGTGLGLATIYGIVKQANGHIWIYSEEGEGTTFKIYLPRSLQENSADDRPSTAQDVVVGGNETLLLVEDSQEVRQLAETVLTGRGYRVLIGASGAEAVAVADAYPDHIHLLLTDVIMPGMNGKELSRRLTVSRPDMKILFMSGYTENAIAHHGVVAPGVAFLQKPLGPLALARKVRQVLDSQPTTENQGKICDGTSER